MNTRDEGASGDTFNARWVDFIACRAARETGVRRRACVVLTLSDEEGAIDQVALSREDGVKLSRLLAEVLHLPKENRRPAKKWAVPHSVSSAELEVGDDLNEAIFRLRQRMPEIAEFIELETKRFKRGLGQRGTGAARSETIIRRFMRAILIAVEAVRD